MKILVFDCEKHVILYKLLEVKNEQIVMQGVLDGIGVNRTIFTHSIYNEKAKQEILDITTHSEGIKFIMNKISNHGEIIGVGHRVVHGSEKYSSAVIINEEVKKDIKHNIDIAPLHNYYNLLGINAVERCLPHISQVAIFDTAFYHSMPEHAYLYGLHYSEYLKHGIRRYGFQGMFHEYVAYRTACLLKKPLSKIKLITCHLGDNSSISAINKGKAIDTSMGFAPLEGLLMATKCGNIDPGIVSHLLSKKGATVLELDHLLNKESGLLGISGVSGDIREIIQSAKLGNKRAQLTIDIFCYKVKKYIGSYISALNGLDILSFASDIGENIPEIREGICKNLEYIGIKIDKKRNKSIRNGKEGIISSDSSRVKIMVVHTDELLIVAKNTKNVLKNNKMTKYKIKVTTLQ